MVELIKANIETLKTFDKQRKNWLKLSGVVFAAVLLIIIDWNHIRSSYWGWIAVSLGLIISVLWWYWTMGIIRKILISKQIESEILMDLVKDIKSIKQDVKKINSDY